MPYTKGTENGSQVSWFCAIGKVAYRGVTIHPNVVKEALVYLKETCSEDA